MVHVVTAYCCTYIQNSLVMNRTWTVLVYCFSGDLGFSIIFEPVREKTKIFMGENKDADQLRGNREADQRLCFRYLDSIISLLLKSGISSF